MGAGAWKTPKFYGVGMEFPKDKYGEQRVRWANIGIQRELIRQGFMRKPLFKLNGGVGPTYDRGIKAFQKATAVPADGRIGPKTAGRIFFQQFSWWEITLGIPDHLLIGLCRLESGFDPGAEGFVDDRDRGILQFNRLYHPDITDEIAFSDPPFCIARGADMLMQAYNRFKDGNGDPWKCAVASHNNPKLADQWSREGNPPVPRIEEYVNLVYKNASIPM